MKTCEEVWLSKVFEIKPHTRGQAKSQSGTVEGGSEISGSELMPHAMATTHEERSR